MHVAHTRNRHGCQIPAGSQDHTVNDCRFGLLLLLALLLLLQKQVTLGKHGMHIPTNVCLHQ
jgi:hypothetical protein